MKNGYTLTEILIVITIMLIVIGVTSVSYSRNSQQRGLAQDADALVDVLNQARERTIARDIGNAPCLAFTGYSVAFTPTTGTYDLSRRCGAFDPVATFTPQHTLMVGVNRRADFQAPYGTLPAAMTFTFRQVQLRSCQDVVVSTIGTVTTPPSYAC